MTKIIELNAEFKTLIKNTVRIVSEFTFLFWLDNIEHINEKRIEFGQTYKEEIKGLKQELNNLRNPEYCSPDFESILKVSSDSLNYIIGLDSNIAIIDQGQSGSATFNHSKSMTSTSTPKYVQTNTSVQIKQKSSIKPDKPLTSNLFGLQNNAMDEGTYFSDAEDNVLQFNKGLSPSVNQRIRRRDQDQTDNYYNNQQTSSNILTNNREHGNLNQNYHYNYEQIAQEYNDLRDEITTKVTNHTNKLIDNLEYKFAQLNANIERKREEVFGVMFDRLNKT